MTASAHASFPPPADPNAVIWRYIDIPKLLSFLMTRSLHFTSLQNLSDPFEGGLPPNACLALDEDFIRTEREAYRNPGNNPQYARNLVEWVRRTLFVNCWCCQPTESEALWRIYGNPSGAAIKTSFSKLANALPDNCKIGMVTYLDYEVSAPSASNYYNLVMHKRRFFEHEREVRAVIDFEPWDWADAPTSPDKPKTLLAVPVPFDAFESICLSPFAPDWVLPLIQDAARRYDCPLPVCQSRMLGSKGWEPSIDP